MKTNSGLIEYCLKQLNQPYWWGTFGQEATPGLFAAKKKQYPSYYTASDFKNQYGKRVHDCIGLIKGYLWSDSPTSAPKYVAAQDKSASGMYTASKIRGAIGTFDFIPGRLIYKGKDPNHINHVGVYIGAGLLVEAKGHAYGVVKGAFQPSEWNFWSQCPYIEADLKADQLADETSEYSAPNIKTLNGIDISDVQWNNGLDLEKFIDKHPEIDFYLIKCTRGASSVNTSFKPWIEILLKKGKLCGAYHFLNNDQQKNGPIVEAKYFYDQIEPYLGEIVLALDYENDNMGFAAGEKYAEIWLNTIKDLTGITPLIYTQQSRVYKLVEIQKAGYPLWVAKYGENPEINKFQPKQRCDGIDPYTTATIFQYSSNFWPDKALYGNKLDCNVFYGSEDDWKALAGKSEIKVMINVAADLPELKKGTTGRAVRVLQFILGLEGFTLATDGIFGAHTEVCVKSWQSVHNLTTDGIVGKKTWSKLLEVL